MAIPTCKEFWEFNHSREQLERTGVGSVLGKSVDSFSHRVQADFNGIITEKNDGAITS